MHRTGLDAGETRFALQLLRDQLDRPVWPVHRLDKGTSGVLLFALSADMARHLGACFETPGQVHKQYRAMVRGWPPESGLIDHPLVRLDEDRGQRRTDVQDARTQYQLHSRFALPLPDRHHTQTRCAQVRLTPLTGRRHQLRRHLKHLSHPILGDATHGKGPLNRAVAALLGTQRLWLHAQDLQLPHPVSGQTLRLHAPLGPEWALWEGYGHMPQSASPQPRSSS